MANYKKQADAPVKVEPTVKEMESTQEVLNDLSAKEIELAKELEAIKAEKHNIVASSETISNKTVADLIKEQRALRTSSVDQQVRQMIKKELNKVRMSRRAGASRFNPIVVNGK